VDPVVVLFVRADSIYKTLPGVECYDEARDARTWPGGCPVVAHPPCKTWGMVAPMVTRAKPGEKELGPWAVEQVRRWGGVLEHPAGSRLFAHCGCAVAGGFADAHGFTSEVDQFHWGHRCSKPTRLYVVGCSPMDVPAMPIRAGKPTHCITQGHGVRIGHPAFKSRVPDWEREATPPAFAAWLVELARRCSKHNVVSANVVLTESAPVGGKEGK
jgi:hypothetical protein